MAYAPVGESTYDASLPGVRTGLSLNFRSRKQVIDAVNYLFQRIMKQSVAEIDYTGEHRLNLGANYPEVPGYKLATELLLVERDDLGEAGDAAQGGSQAGDETGMPPRGAVPGEPGILVDRKGKGILTLSNWKPWKGKRCWWHGKSRRWLNLITGSRFGMPRHLNSGSACSGI